MEKTRNDLIRWVQARIDEFAPNDQIASYPPSLIGAELDATALDIIQLAPINKLLTISNNYSDNFVLYTGKSIIIPISDDIIRYLKVKLKNWKVGLTTFHNMSSPQYKFQSIDYLKAVESNPFCAEIPFMFMNYHKAIECFPAPVNINEFSTTPNPYIQNEEEIKNAADQMGYVAIFNKERNSKILNEMICVPIKTAEQLEDEHVDSLIWGATARVLENVREVNLSKVAYERFIISLGINPNPKEEKK